MLLFHAFYRDVITGRRADVTLVYNVMICGAVS
jgi:hypothetical protein